MHALAGKKKSSVKKKKSQTGQDAKKREKARRQLRAVDEQTGGGEDREDTSNPVQDNDSDDNNIDRLTQEHIAQLFEGELDEFAALTSRGLSNSSQRHEPLRIQYVVENEVSGDFFRVRGSAQQHRKPWAFASRGPSFGKLEAALHREADQQQHRLLWSQLGSGGVLRDLETALVVMCQGILAGLCWMDAFNLSASDGAVAIRRESKDRFACTYSAVADRSRQLFFILFKYPSFIRSAI